MPHGHFAGSHAGQFRDRSHAPSKRVKKWVHKAILAADETKNVTLVADPGAGTAATNFTGSMINLCPTAQGDNINDRTGNIIRPVKLKVRGQVTMAVATISTKFRYIVFRSKQQPNNTAPTTASVLAAVGANTATESLYATGSVSNAAYDILIDKIVQLNNQSASAYIALPFSFTLTKKVKDRLVHYTGAGTADYGKGALFMLIISDMPTATSPGLRYGLQLWYKDG